ncbi:putative nucleotidase YqfW [Anoxybacillus voinovskiensis]|nr:putative nucleotidase YqfW [Anoxybacillus voinovskiensis]
MLYIEMKKRLGIDIDGTVTCPSTFIPYLNRTFQKQLTLADITQYNLAPLYDTTEEEIDRWMEQYEAMIYKEAPLAPNALEVIDSWKQQYELFYISARGKHLYDITEQWFQKHGVHYHHIELIGSHDKIEAVKTYNIAAFFEDKYDNACDIGEQCNIPVILFDTPYNQGPLPKQVIRVKTWLEAKQHIDRLLSPSPLTNASERA